MTTPRIFLSAGEASGELYGAQLVEALRARVPDAECFGLGGRRMEELGFRRIVRSEDVAHMGITEVVRHMPRIYAEFQKLKASLRRERPDVAILIDFPDVNLRLAEELHRLRVPVMYFVSPQLWAWKKRRIKRVKKYVTRMLVIFPFEVEFYRGHGVDAEFVGHPLAELPLPTISREDFAQAHGLDPAREWIGLLPGSRRQQVRLNLPEMVKAARLLLKEGRYEFLVPVAPTLDRNFVKDVIEKNRAAEMPLRLVNDARAALLHARASIVSSGTATVDAAMMGNPFVVVYRLSKTSYAVAKRVVTVPHLAMVNLVAGYRLAPELIQDEFTGVSVVENLRPVLVEGDVRRTMQEGLRAVRAALGRSSRTQVLRYAQDDKVHGADARTNFLDGKSRTEWDASQTGSAPSTGTAIERVAEIALSYTLKDRQSSSNMENPSGRPVSIS